MNTYTTLYLHSLYSIYFTSFSLFTFTLLYYICIVTSFFPSLHLIQVDVNPDIFLRAFPHVMADSIAFVRNKYGSVDSYLDKYGFDENWRRKLRLSIAAW